MRSDGRDRSAWRRVVVAVLVIGGVAFAVRAWSRGRANASKDAFRRVQVTRQDLHSTKTATGEVTPQNRVEIKPPIAGRVEEVLVAEGEAVTKGQVLAWMSSAERAALLDAARAQGPEAVARWEAAYKPAPLMAPLDGTVIVRKVEPGQTVTTSDPVVVIADRLIVKAQVDETDIGAIAVGQQASITLDAFPDQTIPAHVDHIAYEAKTVNNVTIYEVDVLPDRVPDVMRSGMTATVTFTVAAKPGALAMPAEAAHQEGSQASVLVPGAKAWDPPARRPVTTGMTDGKWVEIVSGLEEGDTVLVAAVRLPKGGPRKGSPLSPFSGASAGNRGNKSRSHP